MQHGVTPLHRAALCGKTDIAEILLDHGATVNVIDEVGISFQYKLMLSRIIACWWPSTCSRSTESSFAVPSARVS